MSRLSTLFVSFPFIYLPSNCYRLSSFYLALREVTPNTPRYNEIMGGAAPPFLYDPPSRWNFEGPTDKGFNPKAVTQASWTPKQSVEKKTGPLVNFNRHPDSVSASSITRE